MVCSACKSKTNIRDRHYHEFEDWQFDWLLEKSGWQVKVKKNGPIQLKKSGFVQF